MATENGSQHARNLWLTDWVVQSSDRHEKLLSMSRASTMTVGTGLDILSAACDFVESHVEDELIFVTCFWAESESLSRVSNMLLGLSAKALAKQRKIKVRICVSSLSLTQKLFHTWSSAGKIYKASELPGKFQLPSAHNLTGLDLQIKSVFIPPFSVMHSKFIVIDRKVCLLPSCNVSWENWFEGCVDLRGPIVNTFVDYWESFWGRKDTLFSLFHTSYRSVVAAIHEHNDGTTLVNDLEEDTNGISVNIIEPFGIKNGPQSTSQDGVLPFTFSLSSEDVQAAFLPSPHHQNPHFRPFPCQKPPKCPQTPLNTFVLQALEGSRISIFLQTPNVTSPPVLSALRRALRRGVRVHIITNERLMRLEQLATAGTTTPRCLAKLIKFHKGLQQGALESQRDVDGEEGLLPAGKLLIEYFAPSEVPQGNSSPVSSHLKLTIVDGETVILGSGNMDRASWYTSQELGVALLSHEVALRITEHLMRALKGRVRCLYKSHDRI